jgi:uncharacterized protein
MSLREVFFLPVGVGQRFCIYHPPQGLVERGIVLYIHPFAEEMNKSRRMAALQSRALAEAGFGVLQIDLLGCGDSSGDFGDATWEGWKEDVVHAVAWLREQTSAPLTLWGLRVGCLLAADVAVDLTESPNFLFWQPVLSGKQYWQQFMRLKAVSEVLSGDTKGAIEKLRQQLAAGNAVEVAGYAISPILAEGLAKAELDSPARNIGQVSWLEISNREEGGLAPVSQKRIEQWQLAGFKVNAKVVRSPAFWQTNEIEDAPELIAVTIEALESLQ